MKDYHGDTYPHFVWVTREFDFDVVKRLMGMEREQVIDAITCFDGYVEVNNLHGYIDVSDILTDAFNITLDSNFIYQDEVMLNRINWWRDYFALLWDTVSSNEDLDDNDDVTYADAITDVGDAAHKLLNILVLGLAIHFDETEKEYLANHVAWKQDIEQYSSYDPYQNSYLHMCGDLIIFPCLVGEDCESEDQRQIHSVYRSVCDRKLPSTSQRDRRHPHRTIAHNQSDHARCLSKETNRDRRGKIDPFDRLRNF